MLNSDYEKSKEYILLWKNSNPYFWPDSYIIEPYISYKENNYSKCIEISKKNLEVLRTHDIPTSQIMELFLELLLAFIKNNDKTFLRYKNRIEKNLVRFPQSQLEP